MSSLEAQFEAFRSRVSEIKREVDKAFVGHPRMVDEVLPKGTLAVVPQAGHSVMTDNPEGFEEALSGFLLAEE